ncbi:MAG: N-acetylmuramoyl-L-alanine amidase family protein, partial [Acidobacteriaceae bacterium]
PTELRFVVLLDPAHGGADTGAMLDPATPEKTYTLALADQLRAALVSRGIRSIFTRDSDVALDSTARATIANRSHASACILLHATSTGNGVHLFTSSLPAVREADPRRAFLPWQTAQASYETSSLRLESDVDAALTQQHIPALIARTSLMPLDSMACPAVAIEVAPLDVNTPLSDPGYRQKIVDALDAALAAWRSDWRQQP